MAKFKKNQLDSPVTVYHFFKKEVEKINGNIGYADPLPNEFVISPGRYCVNGRVYHLENEGLYRFLQPPYNNQQRIVYQKNVIALISGICWTQTHGTRDDGRSHKELLVQVLGEKIIGTCGPICDFAKKILDSQGVQSRVVCSKTLSDYNTFDTGHVMLEVFLSGRWVLFDIDMNISFVRHSKMLSLFDCVSAVQKYNYKFDYLSSAIPLAIGSFGDKKYDYSLWAESMFHSENSLRSWYRRILMVPLISDGTKYCFTTMRPEDESKARQWYPSGCMFYLAKSDFKKRFYEK